MATSDITVSSLIATFAVRGTILQWNYSSPFGDLLNVGLDAVEVYASTTNDRSTASKVNEGKSFAIHAGIVEGTTYYYWIKARDRLGNYGAWYPASSTSGLTSIAGTVSDSSITAAKISVASLAAITATLGSVTAGSITTSSFKSAASGARTEIDASSNRIRVYDSSNNVVATMGDETSIYDARVSGAALTSSSTAGAFTATGSGAGAVFATALTGYALFAQGGSGATAVYGKNTSTGPGVFAEQLNGHNACLGSAPFGGFAFYSSAGGYGPFTGAHDALLTKETAIAIGDIVVDVSVLARNGVSDTITEVRPSSKPREKTAIGIVAARRPLSLGEELAAFIDSTATRVGTIARHRARRKGRKIASHQPRILHKDVTTKMAEWVACFDLLQVNALGEGQINVCGENGPIAAGDLLTTSSVIGKAMRQDDDIVRSCTVARAREGASIAKASDLAQVACIYLCG